MNDKRNQLLEELENLKTQLSSALLEQQNSKEELENFLSQFTCVLDAPSCGCSEDELNDPNHEALFTEQDRLTKRSKSLNLKVKDLNDKIQSLTAELEQIS